MIFAFTCDQLGLIPSTPYGDYAPQRVNPEVRAMSNEGTLPSCGPKITK